MRTYVNNDDLREMVRRMINYNNTQKLIAVRLGISSGYLCDFLSGNREAGPKILSALGYDTAPFYRLRGDQ